MHIPRDNYLSDALNFTQKEKDWQAEILPWLPDSIVDAHSHCTTPEQVQNLDGATIRHMMSTFPSFTLEESRMLHENAFPGKHVRALRFAHVFRGIAHRANNRYLLDDGCDEDRVALFGLPEDPDYTIAELRSGRYHALKMYFSYVQPPASLIYEFFRPEILVVAQELGVPIILHLPQIITATASDLCKLVQDFPRLKIVLAHMGLTKMVVPGLAQTYEEFAQHPNVFMDTAMVPSPDVIALGLKHFGGERILYGSDDPLSLVRARVYEHPTLGQRLITRYPYHWVDPDEHRQFKHLAEDVTHALWPCLQAIRDAVQQLPEHERATARQNIFHDNATRVYNF